MRPNRNISHEIQLQPKVLNSKSSALSLDASSNAKCVNVHGGAISTRPPSPQGPYPHLIFQHNCNPILCCCSKVKIAIISSPHIIDGPHWLGSPALPKTHYIPDCMQFRVVLLQAEHLRSPSCICYLHIETEHKVQNG